MQIWPWGRDGECSQLLKALLFLFPICPPQRPPELVSEHRKELAVGLQSFRTEGECDFSGLPIPTALAASHWPSSELC